MDFFSTSVNADFDDAVLETKDALQRHGFEVLADIDMRRAFKKHLAIDFRHYLILSAYDRERPPPKRRWLRVTAKSRIQSATGADSRYTTLK